MTANPNHLPVPSRLGIEEDAAREATRPSLGDPFSWPLEAACSPSE